MIKFYSLINIGIANATLAPLLTKCSKDMAMKKRREEQSMNSRKKRAQAVLNRNKPQPVKHVYKPRGKRAFLAEKKQHE